MRLHVCYVETLFLWYTRLTNDILLHDTICAAETVDRKIFDDIYQCCVQSRSMRTFSPWTREYKTERVNRSVAELLVCLSVRCQFVVLRYDVRPIRFNPKERFTKRTRAWWNTVVLSYSIFQYVFKVHYSSERNFIFVLPPSLIDILKLFSNT